MKDKHGEDLNIGDRIVFVELGSSPDPLIGLITTFTPKLVIISYKRKWMITNSTYVPIGTVQEDSQWSTTKRSSHKVIKI